jgi:hypothetical protein
MIDTMSKYGLLGFRLFRSLLAMSTIAALGVGDTVFSEATNAPVSCEYTPWSSEERTHFQEWTNNVLSGLKMELREACDIYVDVACTNRIATERLYVFYDPNLPSFIKKVNEDVRSLQEGQFDFFAWKTLGDYVKYGKPPVAAALWIRVNQTQQEEVLRMHIFRPGDYVFQHFGKDHIYVDGPGVRSYVEKIPSSVFGALPWKEDALFSRSKASALSMLVPEFTWVKGDIPKVSHFHTPGFHEGYLKSDVLFPCQRHCSLKLGYVDQELFDVCFSFTPAQSLSSEGGTPTTYKREMLDLNKLSSKEATLPDLSRFTAFAEEMGCVLVYALKYRGETQWKVSEYFFSTPDRTLQFSAFEMKGEAGRSVWTFSYYIDIACAHHVRIPSFFRPRKKGCLVEATGTILREGTQKLIYRTGNEERPTIRLTCLQEDISRNVLLARQPNENGEYWLFQDGKLMGIKKNLTDDVFTDNPFVSPVPLGLECPVIGRTGYLSLRPDCR